MHSTPRSEADPAVHAYIAPIVWWVSALRQQLLPRGVFLRPFSAAINQADFPEPSHSSHSNPVAARTPPYELQGAWNQIRGPASATLASIKRLGWTPVTPLVWRVGGGLEINIDMEAPSTIRTLAKRSARDTLWNAAARNHAPYSSLIDTPFLEPIYKLLAKRSSEAWTLAQKRLLRTLVALGVWSPMRLKEAGLSDGKCWWCSQPESTLWHLSWECTGTAMLRDVFGFDDEAIRVASLPAHSSLWVTGLMVSPARWLRQPIMQERVIWVNVGPDGPNFGALGFGDGSGLFPDLPTITRCGWGGVSCTMLPEDAEYPARVQSAAYGPLARVVQDVPAAELHAWIFYLRNCTQGHDGCVTYVTDCKWLLDSYEKGQYAMTNAWAVHSDLWTSLFRLVDDLGGPSFVKLEQK